MRFGVVIFIVFLGDLDVGVFRFYLIAFCRFWVFRFILAFFRVAFGLSMYTFSSFSSAESLR